MAFVLGLSGSLRKAAATTGLFRSMSANLPNAVRMEVADLNLPLFNRDLEGTGNIPDSVRLLRQQVQIADAFIFSIPEHAFGVASPLQNAIDWSIKHRTITGERNPFKGKVCAVVGVGIGHNPKNHSYIKDFARKMNMTMIEKSLYFNRTSVESPFNLTTGEVISEEVREQLRALVEDVVRATGKEVFLEREDEKINLGNWRAEMSSI